MPLQLYFNIGSQPCRAVRSLLIAGGIEFELKGVDFGKDEQKSPEILALNPSGQVPFIVLDGMVMVQSAAILRFLACKYPTLNKYYEGSLEQKQAIDAMLDFNESEVRPSF